MNSNITIEEFKKVKKNSLDLNNKKELQQDKLDVYKIEIKITAFFKKFNRSHLGPVKNLYYSLKARVQNTI